MRKNEDNKKYWLMMFEYFCNISFDYSEHKIDWKSKKILWLSCNQMPRDESLWFVKILKFDESFSMYQAPPFPLDWNFSPSNFSKKLKDIKCLAPPHQTINKISNKKFNFVTFHLFIFFHFLMRFLSFLRHFLFFHKFD